MTLPPTNGVPAKITRVWFDEESQIMHADIEASGLFDGLSRSDAKALSFAFRYGAIGNDALRVYPPSETGTRNSTSNEHWRNRGRKGFSGYQSVKESSRDGVGASARLRLRTGKR